LCSLFFYFSSTQLTRSKLEIKANRGGEGKKEGEKECVGRGGRGDERGYERARVIEKIEIQVQISQACNQVNSKLCAAGYFLVQLLNKKIYFSSLCLPSPLFPLPPSPFLSSPLHNSPFLFFLSLPSSRTIRVIVTPELLLVFII
jgi:hypothetical protein